LFYISTWYDLCMPAEEKKIAWDKVKLVLVLVIFALLFISLSYYLVLYFKVDRAKIKQASQDSSFYENRSATGGKDKVIKHQYPVDAALPNFVVRSMMDVPDEMEADFDILEYFGVRVVSTGKFSTTTIKNPTTSNDLAEVLQLEVYIDDKEGYFTSNKPFNIALGVYIGVNEEGVKVDVAPSYIKNIFKDFDSVMIIKEVNPSGNVQTFTEDEITLLNEKLKILNDDYYTKTIEQSEIENMFKENTVWLIVPYLKDDLIKYTLSNDRAVNHNFTALSDEYYNGGDSNLVEKILSKDMADLKEPVMITDLYIDSN